VTHADLEDYEERKNTFKETIQQALTIKNILCIVNENDPFSTEEMKAL
jgi:glutamate 5-kinase